MPKNVHRNVGTCGNYAVKDQTLILLTKDCFQIPLLICDWTTLNLYFDCPAILQYERLTEIWYGVLAL